MKRFIKNNLKIILTICCTAIICISGITFAAYQYQSSQVEYKDGKSVETALNELFSRNKTTNLLWKNPNPNIEFSSKNISLDLSNYSGIIILGIYDNTDDYNNYKDFNGYRYIAKNHTDNLKITYCANANDIGYRSITVTDTGVEIGPGHNYALDSNNVLNMQAIPTYIFGIK